jgi:uncharacterized membrane protein YidH (DUF202 family)
MQSIGLFLIILAILIIGLCVIHSVQIISQQKEAEEHMHLPNSYLCLPPALCVMLNESFCFPVFHFPLCEHGENGIYLVA